MNTTPKVQPQPNSPQWIWVVVIVIVILIIGGGLWYFMSSKSITQPVTTPTSQSQSSVITSDSDLQTATSDLDKTDIDGIDAILDQNDTDAAQF